MQTEAGARLTAYPFLLDVLEFLFGEHFLASSRLGGHSNVYINIQVTGKEWICSGDYN